jgi:hypothetical protein
MNDMTPPVAAQLGHHGLKGPLPRRMRVEDYIAGAKAWAAGKSEGEVADLLKVSLTTFESIRRARPEDFVPRPKAKGWTKEMDARRRELESTTLLDSEKAAILSQEIGRPVSTDAFIGRRWRERERLAQAPRNIAPPAAPLDALRQRCDELVKVKRLRPNVAAQLLSKEFGLEITGQMVDDRSFGGAAAPAVQPGRRPTLADRVDDFGLED